MLGWDAIKTWGMYVLNKLAGSHVFMQYTGLKDKNGKEIYDGDILKHDLWGTTKVIWEHGMFRADNEKTGRDMLDVSLYNHQLPRTRVIGNVYENPELLTQRV